MGRSVYPRTIVEKTPNHIAGMPSYTAWTLWDFQADGSTPTTARNRPRRSIQIYDTTPAAASDDYIKRMVQYIHEATWPERDDTGRHFQDRIELYGLPVAGEDETARAERCVEHQEAEIVARNATGRPDFYINESTGRQWHRQILIVDRSLVDLEGVAGPGEGESEGGDEVGAWRHYPQSAHGYDYGLEHVLPNPGPQGGFLVVSWGLRASYAEWVRQCADLDDDAGDDSELSDTMQVKRPPTTLAHAMWDFRDAIQWFYETYILDGFLDEELRRAKTRADAAEDGLDAAEDGLDAAGDGLQPTDELGGGQA